jgi:hypothetical protein
MSAPSDRFRPSMMNTIDALYAGFVSSLPETLRPVAQDLPYFLRLAPAPRQPWSAVFSHAVTLEAPRLFAVGLPRTEPELVRRAVLAHALSVIEAFGTDRVLDRQAMTTPELLQVLEELRRSRNSVLESIWPAAVALAKAADRETTEAIKEEGSLLRRLSAVTFEEYRRISLAKQAVGFPATIALARACGASDVHVEQTRRALAGVWLGLQFEDDVGDWEDDWRRGGGAWAVSLARRRLEAVKEKSSDERPTEPDLVRRRVHRMRVLFLMLQSARHQYRSAWRYTRAVGAPALAAWTHERVQRLDTILPLEAQHAGYYVRARKLAPWAAEVLT